MSLEWLHFGRAIYTRACTSGEIIGNGNNLAETICANRGLVLSPIMKICYSDAYTALFVKLLALQTCPDCWGHFFTFVERQRLWRRSREHIPPFSGFSICRMDNVVCQTVVVAGADEHIFNVLSDFIKNAPEVCVMKIKVISFVNKMLWDLCATIFTLIFQMQISLIKSSKKYPGIVQSV